MVATSRKGRTSSSSSFKGEAHFLHPDSSLCCDNRVCVLNAPILLDMLCALCPTVERKLPSVGDLRKEMKALYKVNKRVGPEIDTIVKQDSFHVQKLLSHVNCKSEMSAR